MSVLLGPNGQPISSADYQNKKAKPPALGERYGRWAGDNVPLLTTLPGGGTLGFDPSQLTLMDLRQMKGHYQINSSLSVLTFMMHQMKWHVECEDKQLANEAEEQLGNVWSRLVRAKSQALWAGYSPSVLQWENDVQGRRIVLTKIKDLIPEDCRVHWKRVETPVPGTKGKNVVHIYDGIDQAGWLAPIPVENTYWYPMLMENGNYYGRRLLESAFQPWFFSMLMHLFANRYYERYGEPTPIGRAPYDETIDINGQSMYGNQLMSLIIQNLRNRSTVILPNDKTPFGDETNPGYDYTLEYLESQMRGADFERYMTRLDEEMSLAMFTPILMMRTADVGSYNLGTQHTQVYQWMLNAISGDWAHYINKYILRPIVQFNSPRGERAPRAKIKFMQMGKVQSELLQAMIVAMMEGQNGTALKPDIRELGELAGMTFEEIETVTDEPAPPPEEEPDSDPNEPDQTGNVVKLIKQRVRQQVVKAYREGEFSKIALGYKRQLGDAMERDRYENADRRVADFYDSMDRNVAALTSLGTDEFADAGQFNRVFESILDGELKEVLK